MNCYCGSDHTTRCCLICNFCNSTNIEITQDSDSRDHWDNYSCLDCKQSLEPINMCRKTLTKEIEKIPGFVCVGSTSNGLLIWIKQPEQIYPSEWHGYKVQVKQTTEKFSWLYVGNLPFVLRENELREHFTQFSLPLATVKIQKDPTNNRPRGFALVKVPESYVEKIINTLNGVPFKTRKLIVDNALEEEFNENI